MAAWKNGGIDIMDVKKIDPVQDRDVVYDIWICCKTGSDKIYEMCIYRNGVKMQRARMRRIGCDAVCSIDDAVEMLPGILGRRIEREPKLIMTARDAVGWDMYTLFIY